MGEQIDMLDAARINALALDIIVLEGRSLALMRPNPALARELWEAAQRKREGLAAAGYVLR